jgi:hypothetical protein
MGAGSDALIRLLVILAACGYCAQARLLHGDDSAVLAGKWLQHVVGSLQLRASRRSHMSCMPPQPGLQLCRVMHGGVTRCLTASTLRCDAGPIQLVSEHNHWAEDAALAAKHVDYMIIKTKDQGGIKLLFPQELPYVGGRGRATSRRRLCWLSSAAWHLRLSKGVRAASGVCATGMRQRCAALPARDGNPCRCWCHAAAARDRHLRHCAHDGPAKLRGQGGSAAQRQGGMCQVHDGE